MIPVMYRTEETIVGINVSDTDKHNPEIKRMKEIHLLIFAAVLSLIAVIIIVSIVAIYNSSDIKLRYAS